MAKMQTYTFGENNWDADAALSKAFFDSLNCPIIDTQLVNEYDFTIQFDNSVILKSYGYANPGAHIAFIEHGVERSLYSYHGAYGSKIYTVVYNDKIFYLKYKGISYSNEVFVFLYNRVDNKKIYGIQYDSNSANINTILYKDYNTDIPYTKNVCMLSNGSAPEGWIAYMDHDCISSFNSQANTEFDKKLFDDPNFLATNFKTNEVGHIIQIGTKQYYMAGNHSIVEIED